MTTKGSKLPTDARLFAHPRLEIAGAIARQPAVSFRLLCDDLELSDGNLSAHLRALENEGVITVERTFDGRRRLSQYRLTETGRGRLHCYVQWVEQFARALQPHVRTEGKPAIVSPQSPQSPQSLQSPLSLKPEGEA